MSANYIAKATVVIDAPPQMVWSALTTPELIKKYFFGTEAISEWQEGSEIRFRGQWEGEDYSDKGIILRMVPGKLFQHTYFSSLSGLEDSPENYSNVIYELEDEGEQTQLTVKQENMQTQKAKEKAEENWHGVLESLKSVVENTPREELSHHS